MRKRKRSKRNDNYKTRKNSRKERKKKKARRGASICSTSSGSWSCSTCQSASSSSEERQYGRHSGRSGRKEHDKSKFENTKSGTKRRRYRSRSCSSCSRDNRSSDPRNEKKVTRGNTSKQLMSVITVTKDYKEEKELGKIEHTEEMRYKHDDYPFYKSNDSNNGENNRESLHEPCVGSSRKNHIEDENWEHPGVFSVKLTELTDDKDGEDEYARTQSDFDRVGTKDAVSEKKNESSVDVDSVSGNDLEALLREKALENLRRFRGGLSTNTENPVDQKDGPRVLQEDSFHSTQSDDKVCDRDNGWFEGGSAQTSLHLPEQVAITGRDKARTIIVSGVDKGRLVRSAFRQVLSDANYASITVKDAQESHQAEPPNGGNLGETSAQISNTATSHDDNGKDVKTNNASDSTPAEPLSQNIEKIHDGKNSDNESQSAKDDVHSCNHVAFAGREIINRPVAFDIRKPRMGESLMRQPLPTVTTAMMEAVAASGEFNQAKLVTGNSADEDAAQAEYSANQPSDSGCSDKVSNATQLASDELSSNLISAEGDVGTNKLRDEGMEGSQFEQKTMSVMRGGEMVQVSYKVYIPKKTPALARRQLKR
uniref:Uncharacterized protein DDB_G0287625-like n=1 Tax=Rhizophora mucronata TaxID=61149 RepID=A0A2P2IXW3_RHIMU